MIGAPLGKNVTLHCHIEAFPQSVNFWIKDNGDPISDSEKYEISIKEKGYKRHYKLTIRYLTDDDYVSEIFVAQILAL